MTYDAATIAECTRQYEIPLKELKHSMIVHMRVAGTVTNIMGLMAAKILDLFDNYFKDDTPTEMMAIAIELIKLLHVSILERLDCYETDTRYIKSMTSASSGKPEYLRALASSLRELARVTNTDVVEIFNSDGVIQ